MGRTPNGKALPFLGAGHANVVGTRRCAVPGQSNLHRETEEPRKDVLRTLFPRTPRHLRADGASESVGFTIRFRARGGRDYDAGIPPLGLPFGLTPPYRTPSIEAPEYVRHPTTPRGPISSPPGGISWSVRFSVPWDRGQAHILGSWQSLGRHGESLRGRPRTRRVDSSPSCFAVCSVQNALPYGLPRRTDRRIAWSSASI